MISAFGVDHGEISKAFGMSALTRVGQGIGGVSRTGAKKMGGMAGKNINKPGMRTLGRAQVKTGKGLKRFSNFAQKRPGLVGGAAVGGAGAATFGAGAAATSDKKRLTQYR